MYSYSMFCTIIDVKSRIINISWPSETIVQSVEQAPVVPIFREAKTPVSPQDLLQRKETSRELWMEQRASYQGHQC